MWQETASRVGQRHALSKTLLNLLVFLDAVAHVLKPEYFKDVFDLSILPIMPELVDSPHVQVDPVMRVIYYSALYFGLHRQGPRQVKGQAQAAYYKCLEVVPPWLRTARGTVTDVYAACFTVS